MKLKINRFSGSPLNYKLIGHIDSLSQMLVARAGNFVKEIQIGLTDVCDVGGEVMRHCLVEVFCLGQDKPVVVEETNHDGYVAVSQAFSLLLRQVERSMPLACRQERLAWAPVPTRNL